MKLYNINTDSYITDRATIIDEIVERAAHIATWNEWRKCRTHYGLLSDRADPFLREVLVDDRAHWPFSRIVRALWSSEVVHD